MFSADYFIDKDLSPEEYEKYRSEIFKLKNENSENLKKIIQQRIEEKSSIFKTDNSGGICLIGHSQIDFWEIETVGTHKVRNCGIAGITSKEYLDDIISSGRLKCSEDIYLLMLGTNDIVYSDEYEKSVEQISKIIEYIISKKENAEIYFILCASVNGRLDRTNEDINKLNDIYRKSLTDVKFINTDFMNNEKGKLNSKYTIDGLHFSAEGYKALQKAVEEAINE